MIVVFDLISVLWPRTELRSRGFYLTKNSLPLRTKNIMKAAVVFAFDSVKQNIFKW